jgi:hypothetical protein
MSKIRIVLAPAMSEEPVIKGVQDKAPSPLEAHMRSTDQPLQHTLFEMFDAEEKSQPEMNLTQEIAPGFVGKTHIARTDLATSVHVEHALHIYMRTGKVREATLHMVDNRVPIKVAKRIVRRTQWRSSDPIPAI